MLYSSLVISSLETTSGAHIVKFPSCIINVKFLLSRCAAKCYLYYARFHLCSLQQQFFSHPLRLHLRDRLNGNMSRYVLVVSIVQWQDFITNIFLNANSWFPLIFFVNQFKIYKNFHPRLIDSYSGFKNQFSNLHRKYDSFTISSMYKNVKNV